jgi:hypothetical protein
VTLDYDREVHGHGDRFQPAGALDGSVPALRAEGDTLSAGAVGERVAEAAGRWGLGPADRVLTGSPYGSLASLLSGLLVPLHSGAGVVLCRNPDLASDDMLARRVVQEGVTAVTGERRFGSFGARRLD